ncbi:MAG: ComEC family competence protein [Alphaproteobacteria bacterium]|nr:ComEC family competence protein [Alphaproteobacteria bacterium]
MNYFKQLYNYILNNENSRFNLWLPVAFAIGIIAYFQFPFEPKFIFFIVAFLFSILGFILTRNKSNICLAFLMCAFFLAGVCRMIIQTNTTNTYFIPKAYQFVSVKGIIDNFEWRQNSFRITLSNIKTDKINLSGKLSKIRINIRFPEKETYPLSIGDTVSLKANLLPPSYNHYPAGYNFVRQAYFDKISAVGFAVSDVQVIEKRTKKKPIENIRKKISERILSLLPDNTAPIIIALITGEQGGISKDLRNIYTASGIVHVLSVSGFHMSLIALFVFGIFRLLFALLPEKYSRLNAKKISAILALLLTFLYLLISGMAPPAVRSFLMVMFVLIAVLFDRHALSIHSLTWAGFLILLFSPNTLMSISFALSFSACYTLIFAFEASYPKISKLLYKKRKLYRYIIKTSLFFLITNLVVNLFLAPIIIQHFNQITIYGFLGNLLTSVLFTFLIMPALLISVLLMPFGADSTTLLFASLLIDKINLIAQWISTLPFSTIYLPSFNNLAYAIILTGLLWMFIWKTKIRYIGFIFFIAGFSSVALHRIPDIIISQNAKLIAVNKGDSLLFSTRRLNNVRQIWLRKNGLTNQSASFLSSDSPIIFWNDLLVDTSGFANGTFDIVINNKQPCHARMLCVSEKDLKKNGTHLLYFNKDKITIKNAAQKDKNRAWSLSDARKD